MKHDNKAANELVGKFWPALDKGFVCLVDWMGSDNSIVQAARVSYGKGTKSVSDDRTLIRYLLRNKHTTPFESCELNFMIQMPMDAWRQQIRHRTAGVSEYSTRYSEAIDLKQETSPDSWRMQSTNNKQGSSGFLTEWPAGLIWDCEKNGGPPSPHETNIAGNYLSSREAELHNLANEIYNERLNFGVAKEVARKDLPLSTYTRAYWKMDLHNLFHYLKLRCDSHAQLEIRTYANIIAGIVKECFPVAFDAWYDYAFAAANWTRLDRMFLSWYNSQYWTDVPAVDRNIMCKTYAKTIGMSTREEEEFWKKLEVPDYTDFTIDPNTAKDAAYFESLDKTVS